MKRVLALAAAAAGFVAVVSAANAAGLPTNPQACAPGGYWESTTSSGTHVMPCGHSGGLFGGRLAAEPATTGSIGPAPATTVAAPAEQMAREPTNPQDCKPGGYWASQGANDTSIIMPCR
jgi:hypothetical protein